MHAGRNIFKTWLEELYQLTLAPLIPEAYQKQYTQTLFPTPDGPNGGSVNLSMGTKVLLRALANEQDPDPNRFNLFENQSADQVMSQALNNTYQRLQKKWGSNIKDWKLPTSVKHFYSKNFTGIPQTTAHNEMSFNGFQNRGTANTMIILDAHTVELCDVNPPGQSGFISPSGEYSPHYDDQM